MKPTILSILMALAVIGVVSLPSSAGPPDFSICDGEVGAAFGLCRAGVAIGCDVDDSSNVCIQIEEQYFQITGTLPPRGWVYVSAKLW